jgi:uncharacterized protein involved in exopolysaccharide biosynthesis
MNQKNTIVENDEVDLFELARLIWSKRRFVLTITILFFIFGVTIAVTSKVEYTATAKLMPESQKGMSSELGRLGGLAGLAGINLNMNESGSLTPELYPEIVRSSVFLEKLINTPIFFEKLDSTISGFEYFKELERPSIFGVFLEYTIGLPGKIRNSISSPVETSVNNYNMVRYSMEDWGIIQSYGDRLSVSVEPQTGIITIKAEMPDPVAAAKTASLLVISLTERVTRYKVEKAEISLNFIQERFQESQDEYEGNQSRLAVFTETNRNIANAIVQTEYVRLQNQMNISFEVYKGLATQLEQAKIQVKEETPVFTVLEPVIVPAKKSKPKRFVMVIAFMMLGVIVGVGHVLIGPQVYAVWKKIGLS